MFDILFDPDKIQSAFNLILQAEAMVLGVVGLIRGSDAVKRYQESKSREALHSALESAVNLSRALNKGKDVAGRALDELAESDLVKGIAYVENAVPEAVKKVIGPIGAAETRNQIERMLISKAKSLLGR